MDRDDADQEGITLPPQTISRFIARDEAQLAILQHIKLCPFGADEVNRRLRGLERSFAYLVGFMIGSGILGGAAGALVAKLMK